MKQLAALVKRNLKLFFKDKGMFFSSLITPLILLVLYVTFLARTYKDSFSSVIEAGFAVDDAIMDGLVGGELISSLLAVTCVTVAFCSNLLTIGDKTTGALRDLTVTPVKRSVLALGYFAATAAATLIVSFAALAVSFIYLGAVGWYLSAADVLSLILNVFLLTLFGTALASCVNFPLSTSGQASAVGTIVSAGYGFLCGAYMPISSFGEGLRNVLAFLPGTYGTCLMRNAAMDGALREMADTGMPAEALELLRDGVDCNLYFFGERMELPVMRLILVGSTVALVGLYVVLNIAARKGKKA